MHYQLMNSARTVPFFTRLRSFRIAASAMGLSQLRLGGLRGRSARGFRDNAEDGYQEVVCAAVVDMKRLAHGLTVFVRLRLDLRSVAVRRYVFGAAHQCVGNDALHTWTVADPEIESAAGSPTSRLVVG